MTETARRHEKSETVSARPMANDMRPPSAQKACRSNARPMTYGKHVSPRVDAALRMVIDHGVIGTCASGGSE